MLFDVRPLFEDKNIFALRPFYLMCAHYIPIHLFLAFWVRPLYSKYFFWSLVLKKIANFLLCHDQ